MNQLLDVVLDSVASVDPVLRTFLAGLAIMLETSVLIGLVVPGDTIVLVSSTGVEGPVQFVALALTVIVGALAGESIGFAIGRWFGPHLRASRVGRWIGASNWHRAQTYLERRGGIAVFLSRFLPVLHSLIPLTVGMSTMSYRRFLAWTAPACVIWSFAYVGAGSAAAGGYRELSDELHWAGYLFVAAIVVFALVVLLVKRIVHRIEARHMHAHELADAETAETTTGPDAADETSTASGPGRQHTRA
ncbi:DedA family protein [Agromyces sp. SYSU T00194]|uniref:DedA family protein n=1 Tax=Agromyces chitinivorans TaxID=3158560 RepID=UPI00339185F2